MKRIVALVCLCFSPVYAEEAGAPAVLPVRAEAVPEAVLEAPAQVPPGVDWRLACEVCGCSCVTGPVQPLYEEGWLVSVAEQYTGLGTPMDPAGRFENSAGQKLNSFSAQVTLGYNFSQELGVQLTLPFLRRDFTRVYQDRLQSGSDSGLGDIVVMGRYTPIAEFSADSALVWNLQAGLKLPTGSSGRLREELAGHGPEAMMMEEGGEEKILPESLVGGHDLALGSGSVDGVLGTSLFLRSQAFLFNAGFQYFARTRGSYGYRFGNSFTWNVSPGVLFVREPETLVGLQFNLMGESKGQDDLAGELIDHTGARYVFAGPQIFAATSNGFSALAGVDLPVFTIDHRADVDARLSTAPAVELEVIVAWGRGPPATPPQPISPSLTWIINASFSTGVE